MGAGVGGGREAEGERERADRALVGGVDIVVVGWAGDGFVLLGVGEDEREDELDMLGRGLCCGVQGGVIALLL